MSGVRKNVSADPVRGTVVRFGARGSGFGWTILVTGASENDS